VPGVALPPSKLQVYVVPPAAVPLNVTDTFADGAADCVLSVYAATGEVSAVTFVEYAVPEPQALTPFTAIVALPVPAVRLTASVLLDPLHPLPAKDQS